MNNLLDDLYWLDRPKHKRMHWKMLWFALLLGVTLVVALLIWRGLI